MDGLVLVAAGSSSRFGGTVSKVLRPLAGKPVLVRALAPFLVAVKRMALVVVARREDHPAMKRLLPRAHFVDGGPTRAASVLHGLRALPEEVHTVLVHDAARPLVSADVVRRVLKTARLHGAAAPVRRVHDSLHHIEGATQEKPAFFLASVDRSAIVATQTPQAAQADLLRRAYEQLGDEAFKATDEVGLLRAAGIPVAAVKGDGRNLKITTPADLALAERLLADEV
jgi:2-C-methyl-D-erythritol 4-phosphate cytidylyltransferase